MSLRDPMLHSGGEIAPSSQLPVPCLLKQVLDEHLPAGDLLGRLLPPSWPALLLDSPPLTGRAADVEK
eukprot:9114478-Prorocentrum_lima.AAC.1